MQRALIIAAAWTVVSAASHAQPGPVLRVSILASNQILLNGTPTTEQQLSSSLQQAKKQGGVIWYYRENGTQDPSPVALRVFQLMAEYKMPISMSSKPDFSDYVDERGYSKPRSK